MQSTIFDFMPELGDKPPATTTPEEFRPSVTTIWAPPQRKAAAVTPAPVAAPVVEEETEAGEAGKLQGGELRFMLAGRAYFTLVSAKTGVRFTYRVSKAEPRQGDTRPAPWFVSLLTGPDNNSDYRYIGLIGGDDRRFRTTAKSSQPSSAPSVRAFAWTFQRLVARQDVSQVEIWHEGRCGRCARKLTVPESIALGLGPECAAKEF